MLVGGKRAGLRAQAAHGPATDAQQSNEAKDYPHDDSDQATLPAGVRRRQGGQDGALRVRRPFRRCPRVDR